ncbi:MAG: hypothetical protein ACOYVK_06535 [Bacillota bacterium]
MKTKEKMWVVLTLVLFIVLISKSLFFDEVKNVSGDEAKFKAFVMKAVEDRYGGFMLEKNLVSYRVVSIEQTSTEGESVIEYYDPEKGMDVREEIPGVYKAKVRGYFLHIIPYKEFGVMSSTEEDRS